MQDKIVNFSIPTPSKIPNLLDLNSKGNAGRVAIIGGSQEYTGSPYFAGITSLKTGCDLVHIICEVEACTAIKSYSPELIVHPMTSDIQNILKRCDVLVVGPGMGRNTKFEVSNFRMVIERGIPVVIDADGLYFIESRHDLVQGHRNVLLTPNERELNRLCESCGMGPGLSRLEKCRALSIELQVSVLSKGDSDYFATPDNIYKFNQQGSRRRCGGQGDLLAGALATFLCWDPENHAGAAKAASSLIRHASNLAFMDHGRSMISSVITEYLHRAFLELFGE